MWLWAIVVDVFVGYSDPCELCVIVVDVVVGYSGRCELCVIVVDVVVSYSDRCELYLHLKSRAVRQILTQTPHCANWPTIAFNLAGSIARPLNFDVPSATDAATAAAHIHRTSSAWCAQYRRRTCEECMLKVA